MGFLDTGLGILGGVIGGGLGSVMGPAGTVAGAKGGYEVGKKVPGAVSSAWDVVSPWANPATGYDKAAEGADKASADFRALAEKQWQRQMEALALAQKALAPSQALYNQIYGNSAWGFGGGGMMPPQPQQAQPAQRPPVDLASLFSGRR